MTNGLSLKKTKYSPNPQIKIILLHKISIIKKHIFIEYLQCARQRLYFEAQRAWGLKEFNYLVRKDVVNAL